jgi:hypothetical protein
LWYPHFIMGIKDRLSEVHEHDAREAGEAEIAAQRARERYAEREVTRGHWEKITQAMVESRWRPNAQVATPKGIARANLVIEEKPRGRISTHSWSGNISVEHAQPHAVKQWAGAVVAAIGSLQPAWDMQCYAENTDPIYYDPDNGPPFRFSRSGSKFDRLYLAQDATIYRSQAIDPYHYSVARRDFFPISAATELNDAAHITIEQALAHIVVRRELDIDF